MSRAIQVSIATSKDGFDLKVKESETISDDETGQSHTEAESSKQTFAVFKSALQAATAVLGKFEGKLAAPEGELFG